MDGGAGNQGASIEGVMRIIWVRMPIISLMTVLGALAGGAISQLTPDKYHGMVVMELVEPSSLNIFGNRNELPQGGGYWSLVQRTQTIQSGEILGEVADKLRLVERWEARGRSEVIGEIRNRMTVRTGGISDLIYLLVRGPVADEAAEIANAIVVTFLNRLESDDQAQTSKSLEALVKEAEGLRTIVEHKVDAVGRLRIDLQINPEEERGTAAWNETKSKVLETEEEEVAARGRYAAAKILAEEMSSLDPAQLVLAAGQMGIGDGGGVDTLNKARQMEARLSELQELGLGAQHPVVRGVAAGRDAYLEQVSSHAQALGKAVSAKLSQARSYLEISSGLNGDERRRHDQRRRVVSEFSMAKADYEKSKKLLDRVEAKAREMTMQISMPQSRARVWEWAEAGGVRSNLSLGTLILFGCGAGLLIGCGIAFGMEYLDTSAKTAEEVEEVTRGTVLCAVSDGARLLAHGGGWGVEGEPWQMLRLGLHQTGGAAYESVIAVTSAMEGEGKSSAASNIACVYAQGGARVLLVDCDLRRPSQHRIFGLKKRKSDADIIKQVVATHIPSLFVIPAGLVPRDPESTLSQLLRERFLEEARGQYDLIILDCPPILGLGDARILAREASCTLLVTQHRKYPAAVLRSASDAIHGAGGRLGGVILNRVDGRWDDGFAYYGGNPHYYYQQNSDDPWGGELTQESSRGRGRCGARGLNSVRAKADTA